MFMSILWDTVFDLNDRFENAQVFLIDNRIPALQFGRADKPCVFAAGFGADEWQTGVLLLKFLERILASASNGTNVAGIAVKKAFKKRSFVVIPTICPSHMREEGDVPEPADLKAVSRYLHFHPASLLVTLEKQGGTVFSPEANRQTAADTRTIEKILTACSGLPLSNRRESAAARLCTQVSENALPAFSLAPQQLDASDMERVYRRLEETFAICALI